MIGVGLFTFNEKLLQRSKLSNNDVEDDFKSQYFDAQETLSEEEEEEEEEEDEEEEEEGHV